MTDPPPQFYRLIAEQCRFALMAWDDAQAALEQMTRRRSGPAPSSPEELREFFRRQADSFTRGPDRFWLALQSFLACVNNVSKCLWPTSHANASTKARCEVLRRSLSITRESILKARWIRNDLEHFDERIDAWIQRTRGAAFTDRVLLGEDLDVVTTPYGPAGRDSFFRSFVVSTMVARFQGNAVEIPPLLVELKELESRAVSLIP